MIQYNTIKPLPHVEFQIVKGYSRAKVHFRWAVWTLVQLELVWNGNSAFGILFSEYLIHINIVFGSTQEGAKEQWDKLKCAKAFVRTKESVWCQNKDYVGGATCWSSNSVFDLNTNVMREWYILLYVRFFCCDWDFHFFVLSPQKCLTGQ